MPTKTTKKASKKQTQSPGTLDVSSVNLAPPFAGQAPFNGVWSTFPRFGDYPPMPPPCPGFWAAVRQYPLSGGLVAQLGAQPGTGVANCYQPVGYRLDFTPTIPYELIFNLTLNLGPVTARPRYGQVYTLALLQIWGAYGRYDEDFATNLTSYTGVSLCVRLQMQPNVRHVLQFWVTSFVYNVGYQSYSEIIVDRASLVARYPYGIQAAEAQSLDVAGGQASPLALIDRSKKQKGQQISLKQAIERGTAETRSK